MSRKKRNQPQSVEEQLTSVSRAFKIEALHPLLESRKKEVAIVTAGIKPYVDKDYWCGTCGSRSGKCHPDTGYCYICDTDNWVRVNHRNK